MKKVNYVIVAAFIAILGVFSSCTPTDVEPVGPEIVAQGDKWETKTLDVDDVFQISFLVKEGDANIESLTAILTGNGMTETLFNSEVNATPSVSDMDVVPVVVSKVMTMDGSYTLTVTAIDKDGVTTVETLQINVGNVMADYTTYSAKLLYAPLGSGVQACALSTTTGSTYNQADAKTNATNVDILYVYGATTSINLSCPSDASQSTNTAYTAGYADIATWSVKNLTTYTQPISVSYSGLASANDLLTAYNGGTVASSGAGTATAGRVTDLGVDDVVAFKTAAGKYGVIKVVALVDGNQDGLYNGTSDYVEINVKVQK